MKLSAIVVTYNRLALLKECIAAINSQTRQPDQIIVVNNGSTDGTAGWLATQDIIVITQPNRGGSWGFYAGIKKAYENKADWMWIMDDDTIPSSTALEQLLAKTNMQGIGYLCSKVVWQDGKLHAMNIPAFCKPLDVTTSKESNQELWVRHASFVSLLVSAEACKKVGFPIKEFFIWNDDWEYTERITGSGLKGLYVPGSVVLHKTPENHSSDIYTDDVKNIWKYNYGLRNELFICKNRKGFFKFWMLFFKKLFVIPVRILSRRKKNKWAFIKTVWATSFKSVFFNPEIEKP